jgi:hypothetical protein
LEIREKAIALCVGTGLLLWVIAYDLSAYGGGKNGPLTDACWVWGFIFILGAVVIAKFFKG